MEPLNQRVQADKLKKRIGRLLNLGYSRSEVSERLGFEPRTLRRWVSVERAQHIRAVCADMMSEYQEVKDYRPICTDCGYSHKKKDRQRRLLRMLPATIVDIREAWSCTYGIDPSSAGERALYRDLKDLGAVKRGNEWRLSKK